MTSNMPFHIAEVVKCVCCPAGCVSYAFYPGCDPDNPAIPFHPPQISSFVTDDFFGQFIKTKTIRRLSRADVARFVDRLFILCPECLRKLGNATSDDYLICSFCNIHWDLLLTRPLTSPEFKFSSRLRPDGSLYLRKVPVGFQLDFDDVPF